jgi:hypothetical protein
MRGSGRKRGNGEVGENREREEGRGGLGKFGRKQGT